jgi:ABC-type multidrug transport system ATPase subunit
VLVRGETGAGKTTLLKTIGGLQSSDYRVSVDGVELSNADSWQPLVALVSQSPFLYGQELVEMITAAFKPFDKKEKDDDEEDSAKSRVEDLEAAKASTTLVGNSESEKGEEFRGLAALFAGELLVLRRTADIGKRKDGVLATDPCV